MITYQEAYPWRKLILPLSAVLIACSSSSRRASYEMLHIRVGILTRIFILQILFLDTISRYYWESTLSWLKDTINRLPDLLSFTIFLITFLNIPRALLESCIGNALTELGIPSQLFSIFWLFVVFCNSVLLLPKEASLMRAKGYNYLCV